MKLIYKTKFGKYYLGNAEDVLKNSEFNKEYKEKINLVFTSPPFPLNRKKKYGNKNGDEYVEWLADLSPLFKEYLTLDGSLVIEIGNAWEPGEPVMSVLPIKSLLKFLEKGGYKLCQQFVWHNTAKLPSPAQWVNVLRSRVKDSFTNIWWMSKTSNPKANNKNILIEYSKSMKKLIKTGKYNRGKRPSEHLIGESFVTDNGGAIPSNVISTANTSINKSYKEYCLENKHTLHPARMPIGLAQFFIKFLTEPGDLVLDPFGGSNTTGEAAESLKRSWVSIEPVEDYIVGSYGRFQHKNGKTTR